MQNIHANAEQLWNQWRSKYEASIPCSLDSDSLSRMNFVSLLNSFLNPIKHTKQIIQTLVTRFSIIFLLHHTAQTIQVHHHRIQSYLSAPNTLHRLISPLHLNSTFSPSLGVGESHFIWYSARSEKRANGTWAMRLLGVGRLSLDSECLPIPVSSLTRCTV